MACATTHGVTIHPETLSTRVQKKNKKNCFLRQTPPDCPSLTTERLPLEYSNDKGTIGLIKCLLFGGYHNLQILVV